MNILVTVTQLNAANGGVTTSVFDLCKELILRDNFVVLLSDENVCDCINKISDLKSNYPQNFRFVSCDNVSSIKNFYNTLKTLCVTVKKYNIDIIHNHSQFICMLSTIVKFLTGVPYIWTNHIDEIANPKIWKIYLKLTRFHIISVSTDLKNFLIKNYKVRKERITAIPNGIDLKKFDPLNQDEIKFLKQKYNPNNKYLISLLARMSYGKGHKYLLEAVKDLTFKDDVKILIAGKCHDDEKGYLKELIDYSVENKIDFEYIGFAPPRKIFGISDISVLPSIYEGFGLTVLESLAMCCPVIRSDTPGHTDTADISLIFEKRNVEQLRKYLIYAYDNKFAMKTMGENAKLIVEQKFTINNQISETISVYNKLVKK